MINGVQQEENKEENKQEENQKEEIRKEGKDTRQQQESNELKRCQQERDEYLNGWKRAKADLANYKKDESKRFMQFSQFASEDLIRELVNILDSFDLGLTALEKEGKVDKGIYLIRFQLEDVLRKRGLEKIAVSVGQQFNPATQEAVASVESDKPSGTIIEEVEKGYILNGKLIRPARVKVAR